MSSPRSPRVAVLLSMVFPGLGQLYNRDWLKAAVFAVPASILLVRVNSLLANIYGDLDALIEGKQQPPVAGMIGNILILLVLILWSAVDAASSARRKTDPADRSQDLS